MVGFAAETEHVIEHAKQKLAKKGCDLIVANDVSTETGVMGGDSNTRASRHGLGCGDLADPVEDRCREEAR